ncbi:MAG TPA: helix-turn-helix domain-containing protein, partial [Candidatus Sulfotelmatobacter sp.]|nr:helix-turn-helix domain-containing protein [Candidatus Sulfotelmatobacter sp.]
MSTTHDTAFGRLLRQYRVAAGLSQEALAERAHMSARGISDLERGVRSTPYRGTVLQLADALQLEGEDRDRLEQAAGRRPTSRQSMGDADSTLLVTKLTIPTPRASLVERPRLVDRLCTAVREPLTLISAPAGSGKTTLVSMWRATCGMDVPLAWVSLDPGDNDAARFWSYVVAAIDRITHSVGAALKEMLRAPQPASWESIVTLLINDLASLQDDLVLALDDYHVIENGEIHQALNLLVEHMPPRLHLLISSRADPPLPLARLRARGVVTEIRATDLRFTVD